VMTAKGVVDKWGKIKWAPKRRQDPMGITAGSADPKLTRELVPVSQYRKSLQGR